MPAVIHVKSSLAGVRFLSTTPLHAEICSGLSLIGVVHAFTRSEFVCAVALLCLEDAAYLWSSSASDSYSFFAPFYGNKLSLVRKEGNRDDPFRAEYSTVSCSLLFD